ncbi:periplasmic binding protein [Thiorhodococcus drewsii AZ1]|uniref:Periplasmic binding protein n=1 Tax=Thiorhodococcus drewsii AZ1 TaxID=765913 RepID=G2E470_9GAMM|nr:ABC transporter substrate-binding protein [Thiorhodococcus drewsii]EGV29797.1 periplasmic binding protein [Thiorhodococcus drewsii AZ1]
MRLATDVPLSDGQGLHEDPEGRILISNRFHPVHADTLERPAPKWPGMLAAFMTCVLLSGQALALTVTDVLGRQVELAGPADKIILGEGRFLAVLGVLGVERPLERVAGMMNEFRRFDPVGFDRYRRAFLEIDRIPTFGQITEDSVSVEQAILASPDVAIFGVQGHGPGAKAHHIIDRLEAAGIPVVFIDFRQQPLANTARSVEIVGRVLGLEDAAERFKTFYETAVEEVTGRLRRNPPEHCPSVLLELRVDTDRRCCITVGKGMFADLVEAAGGCNVAKDLLPGAVGELSLEHVIASAPEVYIGSAVGDASAASAAAPTRIVLGPGVDPETARTSLKAVLERPGFADMPAVVEGRAHALWHHFYNSPLNVYALQRIATWLHPERFADLEPERTLERLLAGFAPVDLAGTYAISNR